MAIRLLLSAFFSVRSSPFNSRRSPSSYLSVPLFPFFAPLLPLKFVALRPSELASPLSVTSGPSHFKLSNKSPVFACYSLGLSGV